jgi:hypothetical protein
MAGIAPERGSVDGWYVCFAALSSNDTDRGSWSARTLRGLFLDDNDNNHQNFEVLCNSERCDEKVDEGSKEANRARSALGSGCVSRYQRHLRQGLS